MLLLDKWGAGGVWGDGLRCDSDGPVPLNARCLVCPWQLDSRVSDVVSNLLPCKVMSDAGSRVSCWTPSSLSLMTCRRYRAQLQEGV